MLAKLLYTQHSPSGLPYAIASARRFSASSSSSSLASESESESESESLPFVKIDRIWVRLVGALSVAFPCSAMTACKAAIVSADNPSIPANKQSKILYKNHWYDYDDETSTLRALVLIHMDFVHLVLSFADHEAKKKLRVLHLSRSRHHQRLHCHRLHYYCRRVEWRNYTRLQTNIRELFRDRPARVVPRQDR